MRSTRLAVLSVAVGSALLGWATAGVTAVGSDLPSTTTVTAPAAPSPGGAPVRDDGRPCDHAHDGGHGHRGHPGV